MLKPALETKEEYKRNIGRWVAVHRKLNSMTQKDVSEKANVSLSLISRLERGCFESTRTDCLVKVAKVLKIKPDTLIEFINEKPNKGGMFESKFYKNKYKQ